MGMYIQDDYWEAAQSLTAAQRRDFVSALVEYHYTGEAPNLTGVAKAMFTLCRDRIDAAKRSVENGKNGGRPKTSGLRKSAGKENPRVIENAPKEKPRQNPRVSENASKTETQTVTQTITQIEPALLKSESEREIKEDLSNERSKKAAGRFSAPSADEVAAYWREASLAGDPQRFHDHFTANGWKVGGKAPMRDWRAAARNWSRNERSLSTGRAQAGAAAAPDPEFEAALRRRGL